MSPQPRNLGELRRSQWSEQCMARRSVRQELRENLLLKMERGEELFPGVHGYDDTVIPQIVNAILSRHHFILLGLRGQAKSRIIRGLVSFMDPVVPVVEGCEIHDNPYNPLVPPLPRAHSRRRRRHAHRVAVARSPLRGKARHSRCDHRGYDWRRGPDQSRSLGPQPVRRADHPLRPAAARQSRDFCHQRTARPRRQNSGGLVQHHAGRGHPD